MWLTRRDVVLLLPILAGRGSLHLGAFRRGQACRGAALRAQPGGGAQGAGGGHGATRGALPGTAEVRWHVLGGRFYALGTGGTLLFPQGDGTLRRGASASVRLGMDNAR